MPDSPPTTPAKPAAPEWDWHDIERVLLIRLRSIGDTVLTTPSLTALRRHLPAARIDILLEDWVAPVLDGFAGADNVITFVPGNVFDRVRLSQTIRKNRYDLVYNLHGGSTSAFFTVATRARHRVGFGHYRYAKIYTLLAIPAVEFWQNEKLHSAEQQLALLGWTGVPVADRPRASLAVTAAARESIAGKLKEAGIPADAPVALLHPAAAFSSKEWAAEKFAAVADWLSDKGFAPVAVAAANEEIVLRRVRETASARVDTFSGLSLPEITALAARAKLFAGNDSGIAHIAAAVGTPSVVIFGSSNIDHWRPYTDAPNRIVTAGGGIEHVSVKSVIDAVTKVLS